MPAQRGSFIPSRLLVSKQQTELERFVQAHVLELRGRRQSLREVATIEGSAEAHVRRALGGHERMFPRMATGDHTSGVGATEPRRRLRTTLVRAANIWSLRAPREDAAFQGLCDGPCRDRTCDLGIKSPLLYQLS
jgi:hypothetical protein